MDHARPDGDSEALQQQSHEGVHVKEEPVLPRHALASAHATDRDHDDALPRRSSVRRPLKRAKIEAAAPPPPSSVAAEVPSVLAEPKRVREARGSAGEGDDRPAKRARLEAVGQDVVSQKEAARLERRRERRLDRSRREQGLVDASGDADMAACDAALASAEGPLTAAQREVAQRHLGDAFDRGVVAVNDAFNSFDRRLKTMFARANMFNVPTSPELESFERNLKALVDTWRARVASGAV